MATRWSRVKGPISSAIATLLDHGFEPRAFNQWVDPEGWLWCVDYDAPNLLSAVREILSHHLCKQIWAVACPEHVEPLGGMPDITAYKELAKEFARARLHTHNYYLDAVVQGAMESHALTHFKEDATTHAIICNQCSNNISGRSLWAHLSFECQPVLDKLGDADTIAHQHEQARAESLADPWR